MPTPLTNHSIPSAPREPATNPAAPGTPVSSGSRHQSSDHLVEVATTDGQRVTIPVSSINRSVGTFTQSRDNASVTSLDSLWMSHIESQHHLKDALGAIVVENALTGDHWEADDHEIWEYSSTTDGNKDISKMMARLLVKATKQNRTITDLLQQEHSLKRCGPELLQAILDTFLPVTSDGVNDRFADVSTMVQEQREFCSSFLLRMRFFTRQLSAASGHMLPDPVLRGWFISGTVKHGPYRSILGRSYTRLIRPGGKLNGIPTLDCSLEDIAEHFDNILTGAENNKYYCDSKLLAGEQPIRAYHSRGKAHKTGSPLTDSPSESRGVAFQTSLDTSDPMAIVHALQPFEDVAVTKERAQDVMYHFASPWCVIARHKNTGRHHMSTCEHCIPGYSITFDGTAYKEGNAGRRKPRNNNESGSARVTNRGSRRTFTESDSDDDTSENSGCESPTFDPSTIPVAPPPNSPSVVPSLRRAKPTAKLATIPEEPILEDEANDTNVDAQNSYVLNSSNSDIMKHTKIAYNCQYTRKGPRLTTTAAYLAMKPLPA
ncbi:hypothetical protein SEMRO_892_G216890.1 [Seminavis robusta]|uniref:Uncharacterized protein n=1 Tax=Seminavis robusta TaxID=568900 RepID=A0A9N8EB83_9STRA|nr:hypothetical protein SEMRO_892_G216890.1 [Seminavis robusta]|eukprot:Sro892_g216890.1 n/a (546) ;mRNA; r:3944-5686